MLALLLSQITVSQESETYKMWGKTLNDDVKKNNAMNLDTWNAAAPKNSVDTAELDSLVTEMQTKWAEYEEKKKIATEVFNAYGEIEAKVLERLKYCGKTKYFVEGLGTVSIVRKFQVCVPKAIEQKEKLFKFLADKGKEIYFTYLTINSQSLNAYYNAELLAAQERGEANFAIPGVDEPTNRETLRFTKERTK